MAFDWMKIPYALLTLFIVINYGFLMGAFVQKIAARVGRRHGIPIWQYYADIIKNYGQRTSITHGVMFYMGPVFRLSGGVGLLLFVPTIYGSYLFSNMSFAGDLILALYFIFFGTLGMALGAGESGHPHAAMGVSRGLSLVSTAELPFALAVFSVALQYQSLSVTEIVAAQQGGVPLEEPVTVEIGCGARIKRVVAHGECVFGIACFCQKSHEGFQSLLAEYEARGMHIGDGDDRTGKAVADFTSNVCIARDGADKGNGDGVSLCEHRRELFLCYRVA